MCSLCLDELQGLCGRCELRAACGDMYRAALTARRREQADPPGYPPCSRQLPADAPTPPPWLVRRQRREYGATFVGVVAVYLAAGDASARVDIERERALQALARQWGARLRKAEAA